MQTKVNETKTKTESKRPKQYVDGNLKILEWINTDKEGKEFKSYQFEKFFKDKEGDWKTSNNFSFSDIRKFPELTRKFLDLKSPIQEKE